MSQTPTPPRRPWDPPPSDSEVCPDPVWPRPIRARAQRCRRQLLSLRRCLASFCEDAEAIARDRSFCERFETTPFDQPAADVIAAADELLKALDDLL